MRKAWHRTQGDYRLRSRGYGDLTREQASIWAADDTESERDMSDNQALKDAINGLPDIGAAKEREAIVDWLRELQFWTMDRGFFTPRDIVAEIERGEHLK